MQTQLQTFSTRNVELIDLKMNVQYFAEIFQIRQTIASLGVRKTKSNISLNTIKAKNDTMNTKIIGSFIC